MKLFEHSTAIISRCGLYRYSLTRTWDTGQTLAWVMLNPSTADADQDDATIRRCIAFSQSWGYGRLVVVNLFALRATDPKELKSAADPIGPGNDVHLMSTLHFADAILCAWGVGGELHGRGERIKERLRAAKLSACCLGLTRGGQPKHPLYVRAATLMSAFI
jgi:hypothetical protein